MKRWSMNRWFGSWMVLAAAGAACSSSDGSGTTPSSQPFANNPGSSPGSLTPGAAGTAAGDGSTPGTNPSPGTGEMNGSNLPLGMMPAAAGDMPGGDPNAVLQTLPRSTPEAQGLSSADVLKLVNALDTTVHELPSFLPLRHGQVVPEGFWSPYSGDDIQVLYSGSKSFNGTAVGML